jgi:predicted transposase/invertase (TIGR01784 family)
MNRFIEGNENMGLLPMEADILPPSDDYIFKTILTHPDAKPALIDLVAAVIGRDSSDIIDVQILNNELPAMGVDEKNERLDVNCIIGDGTQINLEMQCSHMEEPGETGNENFISKYIYYLTDLHSSQQSKGIKYHELARTYQVTFSMYTVFAHRKNYITRSSMRAEDGEQVSDLINMIVVELNKMENMLNTPVGEMTSLDMWSAFLGYADKPQRREKINEMIGSKEALGMASAILMSISKDDHERAKFRSRRKFETDMISNILTAEARGENKKAFEVAKKLLARNRPIEEIIEDTGLTREEIENLK